MATNNNDLRDANDLLREQLELLRQVNELQQNSYDASAAAVDSIKEALGINSRRSTFESATLKINKAIAQSILDQKTGLRDLKSISHQINKNQELLNKARVIENGLTNSMSGADLTRLNNFIETYQIQQDLLNQLESAHNLSLSEIQALEQQIRNNDHIIDQLSQQMGMQELQLAYTKLNTSELEKQQKLREGEENIQNQLEVQLGLAGKIAKTLGYFRGITDDVNKALADTTEEMQHIATEEGRILNKWQTFGLLVSKLGSNLSSHLNDPLVIITTMVKVMKDLDSSAGKYAKSMNVTYGEALNVREELSRMAVFSGDTSLNATNLQETLMAVGNAMGSNAKLNEADLKTFTKLREQAGYTNEELMGIQKLSLVNNKTLEANTKEILGAAKAYSSKNKLALNEKQILKDVNSASASLKLSLGGSSTQLAVAASKARELGLNLQQTEKIAESLLNFESSIEAELSAELLTGRNINLEQARLLALNGKTAEAAEEIARQVGTSADFSRMNVIQQEALAKVAGMTRNEFAQSLIDKESLAKLGVAEAKSAQEAYNILKSRGMSEAEIQKKLGDEQLAMQYKQQSVQERFEQTLLHIKEIFISIVDGPLGSMLSIMGKLMENTTFVYTTFGLISSLWAGKMLMSLGKLVIQLGTALSLAVAQATAWAIMNPIGAAVGAAAAIGIGALVYNSMKGNDVVSAGEGTGYGNRTLLMGKDAIQLNNQDTVIAGTNLFGGKQNQSTTVDNSTLIAEIRALRNELNSRPVVVHSTVQLPNGEVLARATNSENRKIHYGVQ
jgi:hypothetical protein